MPSAFIIMPYHDPYENIFESVLAACLISSGFETVRADQVPASTIITEDIENGITAADLVVIEASEQNQNVYFEFGVAAARNKELIILAKTGTLLPFDTRQWRHLLYNPLDLDQLRKQFLTWIHRTAAYQRFTPRATALRLIRGDTFNDIVDATLYVHAFEEPIEAKIERDVTNGRLLPCSYSYSTDSGAESWLRLCQDPDYVIYRHSMELISRNIGRIFDKLGTSFVETSPDFVSLGPGNGYKDRLFLRELTERLINKGIGPELYYYPIDVSPRMLITAVKTVSRDDSLIGRVKIKVIQGNFEDLSSFMPIFDFRPSPNLYCFLGNTLGNYSNEKDLLTQIKAAMSLEDILILEVRSKNTPSMSFELGGRDELQFSLSFSSLQRIGIEYNKSKISIKTSDSFSQISNTKTILVNYSDIERNGKSIKNVALSCVNYYDRDSLSAAVENIEFSIIDMIEAGGLIICVMKRAP